VEAESTLLLFTASCSHSDETRRAFIIFFWSYNYNSDFKNSEILILILILIVLVFYKL